MFWIGFFIGGLLMSRYTIWILNRAKKQELNKTSAEFVSDYLDDMKIECIDIFTAPATPNAYMYKEHKEVKFEIPTHDPQSGELNPYYEELTGKKNPLSNI